MQDFSGNRKGRTTNLDELFKPKNQEIVKFEDCKAKINPYSDAILNMKELESRLRGDAKLEVEIDTRQKKRTMKSHQKEKKKDEFFKILSKELHTLARTYNKQMDEIHMLFMEVCCDLDELKKELAGQGVEKWSVLEDLAI